MYIIYILRVSYRNFQWRIIVDNPLLLKMCNETLQIWYFRHHPFVSLLQEFYLLCLRIGILFTAILYFWSVGTERNIFKISHVESSSPFGWWNNRRVFLWYRSCLLIYLIYHFRWFSFSHCPFHDKMSWKIKNSRNSIIFKPTLWTPDADIKGIFRKVFGTYSTIFGWLNVFTAYCNLPLFLQKRILRKP